MIKIDQKFFIRPAALEDAPKCADIHMRSWVFAYSQYIPMEIIEQHNTRRPVMWEKMLKNNIDTHFVAVYQGKIIGITSINSPRDQDLPNTVYELTGLYFDPDYIGKGFGKKTMDWVKNEISTRGYRKISLWVLSQNTRAKTFYEKNGFKPDGDVKSSVLGDTFEERYICEIDKIGVISHYDLLIVENNDPVHDPEPLKEYMDKWDGQKFIDKMQLNKNKSVLEIGVGTGRLAMRTAPLCGEFYGIDISPKTIAKAKSNLIKFKNVTLICADFLNYIFDQSFDVIYSSLTFMHIEEKYNAIKKAADLLNDEGLFVLSVDKNQSEYIDYGTRKIKVFPDDADTIADYITAAGLYISERYETEFANIFVARKKCKCYCGHDCARCITYIATQRNDDNLRRQSQSFYKERFGLDIPLEKFNCEGGRSPNVFELCKECPFVKCCKQHNVDSCSKCPEYPCKEISAYKAKYVNKVNQI